MFDNIIEFRSAVEITSSQDNHPIPAKLNIPDWFKKLNHTPMLRTVKGCMPFLDALTCGYILKLPQDLYVKHNVMDEEKKLQGSMFSSVSPVTPFVLAKSINLNLYPNETHPPEQLTGCPYIDKNKNLPFYKIMNPWIIKTPPGYSCLFTSVLNNEDDRFTPLAGVVDTDVFKNEINFPIVINGDKYPVLETLLKKGTPYVQVIPFKRESWKMKISTNTTNEIRKNRIDYALQMFNIYKNKHWNKKSWR